jgi:hypothetical protein
MMSFSKISATAAQLCSGVIRIYYQALQTLLMICYQDKWVKHTDS